MIEITIQQAHEELCEALARMCQSDISPNCPALDSQCMEECPFVEQISCHEVTAEHWADVLVIKPQDEIEPDGDDPLSEEDERELRKVLKELEEPYKEYLE